ncbi:MAG: SDR family oxidoreductase [Deltaproteobacteria bacterium]|nr:SDR family oxidoreductase [Deltaproteobacteria bacterium]
MAEPLKGKTTLVTGAAGGIGMKICERFAALGSFVYLCDIKESADLAQAINEKYMDMRAEPVACDIADKEDVRSMYRRIENQRGGIDILINNAAVYGPLETHHFPQISYEDFLATIKIDLSGAVYCTLMALPYMKEQRWGKILFSAAPLSSSGIPCPYLAGKAGFIGLTKYVARHYGEYGISTFALVLRHVGTPMIRRVIMSRGHDVEEGLAKMNAKSLTGRMITPEEIADTYAHFSVNTTAGINGITLLSDGGITYLQ